MRSVIWLLGVCVVAVVSERTDYTGHRLVSISTTSREQLDILHALESDDAFEELDFWTGLSTIRPVMIRASPADFTRLAEFLASNKIAYMVTNDNLQDAIDEERASLVVAKATRNTCDPETTYCTYDEAVAYLLSMEAAYPNNIQVTDFGITQEGRYIYAVKVAQDLNIHKDSVWIEAGTHAREWIAVSSGLNLIARLMNGDAQSNLMLSKYDWNIVPIHNPDGYEYTHTTSRYHRKNRQPPTSGYCSSNMGTDLNRNWDIAFGTASTSSSCSSNTYGGGYAFSAIETAALRDQIAADDYVIAFFSIHCFSELLLTPYGYTSSKPSDYAEMEAVGDHMLRYLETVRGTYYQMGTPPDILYAASGSAYDYFKVVDGIKYAFTYELSPANRNQGTSGFNIHADNITPVSEEVYRSLWAFANLTLPLF